LNPEIADVVKIRTGKKNLAAEVLLFSPGMLGWLGTG